MSDITITNHGSLLLVAVLTDAAREWVDEHVALEGWSWFGNAFACEPRYIANLVAGALAAGLEVN